MFYSFDLFDTLITRRVIYPKDVFQAFPAAGPGLRSQTLRTLRNTFLEKSDSTLQVRVWDWRSQKKAAEDDIEVGDRGFGFVL